jgi:poly(A) polymerase
MILNTIKQIAYSNYSEEIPHIIKEDIDKLSIEDLSILHTIMVGPHVGLAIAILQRIGFFTDLIPEIQYSLDLKSSKHFKEIWPHTIQVIGQTPAILNIRWAALFHDLGKAKAFEIKNNKVTFHHHEHISACIFDQFAKRTGIFNSGQRRAIRFIISNLGYIESYESHWTDSAVRRFDIEVGTFLADLLTLSEADITTGKLDKKRKILNKIQELKGRILTIREKDAMVCVLPKGLGNAISDDLGIPLGPRIGQIRKELENKIEKGELEKNKDIQYYIDYLIKQVEEKNISTTNI